MGRVRQASSHHVTWSNHEILDLDLFLVIQAEHVQGLQHTDELVAQGIFERHALAFYPTGNKQNFFMFHIDAFQFPNSLRELENFGL